MLNSLNNNPGYGNLDGISEEEVVIKEEYEPEPDDYNYVPQIHEVDEAEIRNLSAIREETQVDTRVYKVSAAFLVLALIGGGIGLAAASHSASKADIQRKASIAKTIKNTTETKLSGFDKFYSEFSKVAQANYDEASFQSVIAQYSKYNFMLDMSSEVTSEAVLLAGEAQNPLEGLRKYSADTMLLTQLLSSHVNETRADSDEILELQSKSDHSKVVYAMQVLPDAIHYLATDAPRSQYANGVIGIYTYRSVIEDDVEASSAYSQLKVDQRWSEWQRSRRDYQPANKKEAIPEGLDLPNHLLYRVLDRRGNESLLFADEVILVDRSLLFGKSANALERYQQRNEMIKAVLDRAKSESASIASQLESFIPKDK